MEEAFGIASDSVPEYFLDIILPWLMQVFALTPYSTDECYEPIHFVSDDFHSCSGAYRYYVADSCIRYIATSLASVARISPRRYQYHAQQLANAPYITAQRILCTSYCITADILASEALAFLCVDRRRLQLGDDRDAYYTRQVISAIYPYLAIDERQQFEIMVAGWVFPNPPRTLWHFSTRGWHQLLIFHAIPEGLMTENGQRCYQELMRKLPHFTVSDLSGTLIAEFVKPPISPEDAARMSDRSWVRALEHYAHHRTHRDERRGGAEQLSGVLLDRIKHEPARFYALLAQLPDTIDDAYRAAFINGFAADDVPTELFFAVVRRFGMTYQNRDNISLYWNLEKRADILFPDDIRRLLEERFHGPMDAREIQANKEQKELDNARLNSARCTAFRAFMIQLRQHGDVPNILQQRWALIEWAVTDASSALRVGAIEELLHLMHRDKARAVSLFNRAIEGYTHVLYSHPADTFLCYAMSTHWFDVASCVHLLMHSEQENYRQRGAELATLAWLSTSHSQNAPPEYVEATHALAAHVIQGETVWRRGAARIYAHNVVTSAQRDCIHALSRLVNDEDAQVRSTISGTFRHFRAEDFISLQQFISHYAASRALFDEPYLCALYLWDMSGLFPQQVLDCIETILENMRGSRQLIAPRGLEKVLRSVFHIYTDVTADDTLQRRAMDAFDTVSLLSPRPSQHIVSEWDQK